MVTDFLLSPAVLYGGFAVAALGELYFFMMQRSSLEISRASGVDPRDGRLMLPTWYSLLWPARAMKWGAALAMIVTGHWVVALVLLVVAFFAAVVVPIPHRHFIDLFRRKVVGELKQGGDEVIFQMLSEVLNRATAALDR